MRDAMDAEEEEGGGGGAGKQRWVGGDTYTTMKASSGEGEGQHWHPPPLAARSRCVTPRTGR